MTGNFEFCYKCGQYIGVYDEAKGVVGTAYYVNGKPYCIVCLARLGEDYEKKQYEASTDIMWQI